MFYINEVVTIMWLLSIPLMYTMYPLIVACNAHRRFQAVPGVKGSEWSQLIYHPSLGLHGSAVWVDPFIKTLIKWLMFLPSLHSGCSSGVCCHLTGVLCHLHQAAQASSSQRGRGSPAVEPPPPALSVCVHFYNHLNCTNFILFVECVTIHYFAIK